MMSKTTLIILFLFFSSFCYSQNTLFGTIKSKNNIPLKGASIVLLEVNKKTISEKNGDFKFLNIPNGYYNIEISCEGYKSLVKTIYINTDYSIPIELEESKLDIKEVVIWGDVNSMADKSSHRIEILTIDQFKQKGYLTISEAISTLPGVSQITTGPGIGRPVIRGLSGNRIAIIANGIKLENQQWDMEHALGLTQFGIQRIEVIKGPTSFLYGSEALGGMLNFVDEDPAIVNTIQADAHAAFNSNTFGTLTEFGVKEATNHLNWSIRAGLNNQSDYYSNFNKRVANSRFREIFGKASVGYLSKKIVTQFTYQFNMGFYGIVEPFESDTSGKEKEDHPMEFENPYHTMLHQTAVLKNSFLISNGKINTILSYQNDIRKELEPGDVESNPFLGFTLHHLSANANYEFHLNQNSSITAGVQGKLLSNANFGYSVLIPEYKQKDFGAFVINRNSFLKNKLHLDMAIRIDETQISTQLSGIKDSVNYMPKNNKSFQHLSTSLGINYLINKHFSLFGNIGSGYRAPNAAELTSNGVRLETQRYEKGNSNFNKEFNTLGEVGVNFETKNFEIELTVYNNIISNFIYSEKTTDSIQNLGRKWVVYQFKQQNATIWGGESKLQLHPEFLKWFNYSCTFTSTNGKLSDGRNIPMMPPYKLNQEITLIKSKAGKFEHAFLRASGLYVFNQNKTYTNELSTPGYLILNIGTGGNISLYKQPFEISIGVNNLFNKQYFDHMSRLRQYGVNGIGMNAFISISWKITKQVK